jgi:hypothetical protein
MTVRLCTALLGALAMLQAAGPALAWSDFGHMLVAAAAYDALTPRTKKRVAVLLRRNPSFENWVVGARPNEVDRVAFMRAATWADAIRDDKRYSADGPDAGAAHKHDYDDLSKHADWHYINRPFSADGVAAPPPHEPNVQTQIGAMRAALASPETSEDEKSYALSWLLHLVGDVHQPLHCLSRFSAAQPEGDYGGNDVRISGNTQPPVCEDPRFCPYGPPRRLHAFVDSIVGSGYGTGPVLAAKSKLPKPPSKQVAMREEAAWVDEGFRLAQTAIYVAPVEGGPGPFTVDAGYQRSVRELGQARIALAGARLAALLNEALGR